MRFRSDVRFEFRRFGADLSRFKAAFAALAKPNPQQPSHETYFVTRRNTESNVKIRWHRLQIKGLEGQLHGLQRWAPVLDQPFPVDAGTIENTMAPALGVELKLSGSNGYDEKRLIALAGAHVDLATIVVDKQRTLYQIGDCEAEFSEIAFGGMPMQTVAVEAMELDAARLFLADVGLDTFPNESYADFLHARLFPPTL